MVRKGQCGLGITGALWAGFSKVLTQLSGLQPAPQQSRLVGGMGWKPASRGEEWARGWETRNLVRKEGKSKSTNWGRGGLSLFPL